LCTAIFQISIFKIIQILEVEIVGDYMIVNDYIPYFAYLSTWIDIVISQHYT